MDKLLNFVFKDISDGIVRIASAVDHIENGWDS